MDATNFLDDNYGAEQCLAPAAAGTAASRLTISFLLVSLFAILLIKKTGLDLEQIRRDYLGHGDENVD
jgi:hypothetical protein